jgi:hypothetical protein
MADALSIKITGAPLQDPLSMMMNIAFERAGERVRGIGYGAGDTSDVRQILSDVRQQSRAHHSQAAVP